jgi:hypothetical protein
VVDVGDHPVVRLLSGPMRLRVRLSLVVIILGCLVALAGCGTNDFAAGTCEDVTTYDYNWDNDMKCTRSDGSIFYTDYAGAERFEMNGDE